MKIIDLHQDLMSHIRFREAFGQSEQTSFAEIENSDLDLVIATAFPLPVDNDQVNPAVKKLITEELKMYNDFVKENQSWLLVKSTNDLVDSRKKLLLHVEGLNVFTGSDEDWELLKQWSSLGLRSVATHWNINNELGSGTLDPDGRLTNSGREVISFLEENCWLFDMAHMGRKTFFDAAAIVKRPIYISHGNADQVCNDLRNYTDEQLKLIAKSDGVIGVFFAGKFVSKNRVTVSAVADHIDYLKNLIGVRHVAVGSDFGGIISGLVEGLGRVNEFSNLVTELEKRSYSSVEMESIFFQNPKRIIESHLSQ